MTATSAQANPAESIDALNLKLEGPPKPASGAQRFVAAMDSGYLAPFSRRFGEQTGFPMRKKYIMRLSDEERDTSKEVVKKLEGTSQKVRRAQVLLEADANGPCWTDDRIADVFSCRTRAVEKLRRRLVECGFDETLN